MSTFPTRHTASQIGRSLVPLLFTIAVLIVGLPVSALADSLAGKVSDPQGLAVPGAKVSLFDRATGEERMAATARDGTYRFTNLSPGTYVIAATASNAALIASAEVSVAGEQSLDLTLALAGNRTEVVVTASNSPQTIKEVAKALDIVSIEEIERRGAFQISEAIRLLPGLQVQTQEGPGSFTTIRMRGMRPQDTAVLFDGLRFQDSGSPQNDATAFLEDFTTTDTDRVEVLRGSSSALYGSSAMAGVINVVSRSGGGPLAGHALAEGGGLGMFRGLAGIGGGLSGDRLTYSGSLSFVNFADGVRGLSPYRNTSAQGSVKYTFSPQLSLTGRLWGNSSKLTSSESPNFTDPILANSPPTGRVKAIPLPDDQLALFEQGKPFNAGNATYIPNAIDPDGNQLSSFFNGSVALQHVLAGNTMYRLAYQGIDTRRGYRDGPQGTSTFDPFTVATSHFNGRTDIFQARVDRRVGMWHSITAGYEFMREKYLGFDDTPSDPARTNEIGLSQLSHAFYGQDQIPLMQGRLQVGLAGRAQIFSLRQPYFSGTVDNPYQNNLDTIDTPSALTGDASVAYYLSDSQTKLRTHVGNSYRAPSSYERFGGGFGSYYGDPRLKPERSVAFDAGIDQWLFNSKVQLSGTFFVTELNEVILFANSLPPADPFGRFFGFENGEGGSARGAELSAQLSPTRRTTAQIWYTYTYSESERPTVGSDYYKALNLAPHVFAMSVTHWVTDEFHATFDLFTRSDSVTTLYGGGDRLFVFDGPTKANLVLGYELPAGNRLEVYTKIENLFDKRPYEGGFIGPGVWAIAGVRLKY